MVQDETFHMVIKEGEESDLPKLNSDFRGGLEVCDPESKFVGFKGGQGDLTISLPGDAPYIKTEYLSSERCFILRNTYGFL